MKVHQFVIRELNNVGDHGTIANSNSPKNSFTAPTYQDRHTQKYCEYVTIAVKRYILGPRHTQYFYT